MTSLIYRGYYTVARRYEFYVRVGRTISHSFASRDIVLARGFIKVLNRRATEFDTRAKNWQGPEGLPPLGGSGACSPGKF